MKQYSYKIIIFIVLAILQVNSKLLLQEELNNTFNSKKLGSKFLDFLLNSNNNKNIKQSTTCSKLDLQQFNPSQKFSYSGYLKIKENSSSVYGFTFYGAQTAETEDDLKDIPIIFFFNGGPGSSSQIGNFEELGPIKLVQDQQGNISQQPNEFSWTQKYNVIFIDQPLGTGLSYAENKSEIPKNMEQMREHFILGLEQLFSQSCFKQIGIPKNIPIYLTGESYAGKYIPAIAELLVQQKEKLGYNLQGIAIGDAFTDPIAITEKFADFTFKKNFVTQSQREQLQQMYEDMKQQHEKGNYEESNMLFNHIVAKIREFGNIEDIYNYENTEYDDGLVKKFLLSNEAQEIYQINKEIGFNKQSNTVYSVLAQDFLQQDCFQRLQNVVDSGLQVLVYNGRNDVIVCEDCTISWFDRLNIQKNGQTMKNYSLNEWKVGQKITGQIKGYGNLSLILIDGAGHLVPKDKPLVSQNMIYEFIENQKSQKIEQQQL